MPEARTGAYMLKLTDAAGNTTYKGMVYDAPEFLEDIDYNPVRQGSQGEYLLDMTLLEDKVSRVVLYTENGPMIRTFEDPFAVQQLAARDELPAGDYVVEIHGSDIRYYLRFRVQAAESVFSLRISPNPFTDRLVVEAPTGGSIQAVQLFGPDGRQFDVPVQSGAQRTEIRTSSLPAGMYLLQVTGSDGIRTEKVMKF